MRRFPASCCCLGCCDWTIIEHTALLTSLFRSDIVVLDNLVAETQAIRKKCSKVRASEAQQDLTELVSSGRFHSRRRIQFQAGFCLPPHTSCAGPRPSGTRPRDIRGTPSVPTSSSTNQPTVPEPATIGRVDGHVPLLQVGVRLLTGAAPAPNAAVAPNRRERPARPAIDAPSAKKVYLQS